MSAATEYYGYLLSQGYSDEQIGKFAHLTDQANKGIISHNKAYRQACAEGWNNWNDGGDKKTFGDWVNQANEQGWVEKGLNIFTQLQQSGVFNKDKGGTGGWIPPSPSPPPKKNTMLYVIGAVAIIGVGVAIYFATKKK